MNKKNKGFTLIELLAIIVILAIIAVITVPIILNVIDNAKRGTAQDSAYGYKDAISKYYVTEMFKDNNITLNGDYTVDSNGVLSNDTERHEILFSGTKPQGGHLTYLNNVLTNGCLTIDDYKVVFSDGETTNVERGTCDNVEETPQEPETPQVTYKCKRADISTLHTEECTQTSTTSYCSGAGYTEAGSKGTTTITYGNTTVTQGTLKSGDAFDCDVDGDGEYTETERFYYVSDLYNTTTKQFDDKYAVLVYYTNTTSGDPSLNGSKYDKTIANYNGPVDALENLPTTSKWANITLSNTTRAILNSKGEGTSNNGSNNLPTAFSYEGYAARLLTYQEIEKECGDVGKPQVTGQLDSCIYLLENTPFSNSSLKVNGYWLENPVLGDDYQVWYVYANRILNYIPSSRGDLSGVRPAIEVLKTDIEY